MSSGLGISASGGLEPAPALLCRVLCPCYNTNTITVPVRWLIFYGSCSSIGSFLISAVQLCIFSPTGSTQAPLSHLTAGPWPLLCKAVLHARKATLVTAHTLKCLPYPLQGISLEQYLSGTSSHSSHPLLLIFFTHWILHSTVLCKYIQPKAHFGLNQSKLK